ncbi:uncharacterized protein LOC118189369 [Stegodyphus dumicola]|uniref:uncharacterized protein LOC118189369 n=1 Tax=Stegodyphus dumicola TaxID=202533 RepID=UPI0015A8332D|nr:uncharacterized protein LOC118189369 [Stegodyphus dumicola]
MSFREKKEENPDLQAFLEQHHLRDRLNPRESFFGGRTNALKLFHEGDAKYVDFTSLYPWVNKYCVYPVGHPTIITESFRDVEDYFGIIQCRVIPPRNLYLPVLPYRCRKKLMFPLCRTCALLQLQTLCNHTDDERALAGTWVTEGSQTGEKKGYRVTHEDPKPMPTRWQLGKPVRGFSLNFKNSQLLNFEIIRSLVCSLNRKDVISLHSLIII